MVLSDADFFPGVARLIVPLLRGTCWRDLERGGVNAKGSALNGVLSRSKKAL